MSHKCCCKNKNNNDCGCGFDFSEGICGISPCCILIALAIFFSGRNRC